jgi:hypothetical protein
MSKDNRNNLNSSTGKGDDNMTTVALPKKGMIVIDENKLQKFLSESEKHKITPEFLQRGRRFEKNLIRRDK